MKTDFLSSALQDNISKFFGFYKKIADIFMNRKKGIYLNVKR